VAEAVAEAVEDALEVDVNSAKSEEKPEADNEIF
jgi:hypothetical protein